MVAFAILRQMGIRSVFVINFSLRNTEGRTKTFVKQTKLEVWSSLRRNELGYKGVVMRWVGGEEDPAGALGP
jgi:hypothetical protein